MGDADGPIVVHPTISSVEHEELLNVIDDVRANGISHYIDLPQIIVCGDQSSGKSSCLEAICGLRFPTGDGLCTRFATEYILRRGGVESVAINIVPDTQTRSDTEQEALQSFTPSTHDLNNFSTIISEAAAAMGIGSGQTFASDVLRIEITGPSQPHLTLVDLPGLFFSRSKDQTDEDKDAVFSLVASYISRPRSIILAVVTAKNDLNNQVVLNFARDHDPDGNRTLGIISKPDMLSKNSPSESNFFELARNRDVKFALGWHTLRNRSFEERETSATWRDRVEDDFFSQGIWKGLEANCKGVATLRQRLSKILHDHILSELPSLLKEVDDSLRECQDRLATLGSARATIAEQKVYLLRASQKFTSIMSKAVSGDYTDGFFGSSISNAGYERRLRAVSKSILNTFAQKMRKDGHAVHLVDVLPKGYKGETPGKPLKVLKNVFYKEVGVRMTRNAGTELSGLWNPSIVGDLFFDHSAPWLEIVEETKDELLEAAHTTLGNVLRKTADDAATASILRELINPAMAPIAAGLSAEVDKILHPHRRGRPVTLNHYLIDNLQKKREDGARADLADRVFRFLNLGDALNEGVDNLRYKGSFRVGDLLDALSKRKTEVDMDRFAAIEAVNATLAYYKVALKNVIDAFCMYAVDVCLLDPLPTIFTPEKVLMLDDKAIALIAGETQESITERDRLTKKLGVLMHTQKVLQRLDRHKPVGGSALPRALEAYADAVPDSSRSTADQARDVGLGDDAHEDEIESNVFRTNANIGSGSGFGGKKPVFGASTGSAPLFSQGGMGTSGGVGTNTAFGATGSGTALRRAVPPSTGTAHVRFAPVTEMEGPGNNQKIAYQSINFMQPYQKYSFEELRAADYEAGHQYPHGVHL